MIAALLLSLVALYALAGLTTWLLLRALCASLADLAALCRASGATVADPPCIDARLIAPIVLCWPLLLWVWRSHWSWSRP